MMAALTHAAPPPPDRPSTRSAIVVSIVGGAMFGPLVLAGQVHTPYPFAHLFNSPAIWAAVAFAYGWWVRRRPLATIGSVVSMVVAVETYYLADVLVRGAATANLWSTTAMAWLILGVGAGVVFGTAGSLAHQTDGWLGAFARGVLPAVFGAEAVDQAARLSDPGDQRPVDLDQLVLLLLVLATVSAMWLSWPLRGRDRPRFLVATLVLTTAGALAFRAV
jgi:hypothetical protein